MSFSVITTNRFGREMKKLAAKHRDIPEMFDKVVGIVGTDPFNSTRQYAIRKLEGVAAGEGQYRIRCGRFRFRYDVDGSAVILKACSLRREDSYR
jgi:mRNA-degrading endonuclease RelE of RelBE toxin-antitoxin system